MSNYTVVYKFDCEETQKKVIGELCTIFKDPDGHPFSISAMSNKDEMTRLDLVQFGVELRDIDFIRQVVENDDIEELVTQMMACQEYSAEHSTSQSAAYEELYLYS